MYYKPNVEYFDLKQTRFKNAYSVNEKFDFEDKDKIGSGSYC